MPDRPKSTQPPWEESDFFRETTLQLLDDPEDRDAVRRAGQVLYDLAVVVTLGSRSRRSRPAPLRLRRGGGHGSRATWDAVPSRPGWKSWRMSRRGGSKS